MGNIPFKPDEIGEWSVLKLDIIEKYGHAYTTAFNHHGTRLEKNYIDGFSGGGLHLAKKTKMEIEGSPTRALHVTPSFDRFHFIDLNSDKTSYLHDICGNRKDVHIYTEDANLCLRRLLPTINYGDYKRALLLLDPYKLQLDWEVMQLAGKLRTIDMFLNFPIMDMNRNALLWRPELADPADIERMNAFWGDESWRQIAWKSTPPDLFGEIEREKQPNKVIAEAFRSRLMTVGGFAYVPEPLPMRNSKNAIVYYLFFAAQKPVARNIIESIFRKARDGAYRI